MYEWVERELLPGQCDICGARAGHLKGCLDEPVEIRQHGQSLYAAYWEKKERAKRLYRMSLGAVIVAAVVAWWDLLSLLF